MRHLRIIPDPEYGYLRVDPVPSPGDLAKFYTEHYYAGITVFRDFSAQPKPEELEYFAWRCDDILERVAEHFGRTAGLSLLDVGCGYGYSVRHFKGKGLDARGIEPSQEAVDFARKEGLDVIRGDAEGLTAGFGKKFDVVLLMDVLEHLREPWRLLTYVKEHLINTGGLLVVDVPNDFNDFQTAADAARGLGEWWVVPPQHINYFNVESIQALITRCGFSVRSGAASFPLELFLLMGDVYVGSPEKGRECHNKRVAFERAMRDHGKKGALRRFYESLAELGLGRQVVVYAVPQ